jgi:hypothetical protein
MFGIIVNILYIFMITSFNDEWSFCDSLYPIVMQHSMIIAFILENPLYFSKKYETFLIILSIEKPSSLNLIFYILETSIKLLTFLRFPITIEIIFEMNLSKSFNNNSSY